jgi:hypothetical protein
VPLEEPLPVVLDGPDAGLELELEEPVAPPAAVEVVVLVVDWEPDDEWPPPVDDELVLW